MLNPNEERYYVAEENQTNEGKGTGFFLGNQIMRPYLESKLIRTLDGLVKALIEERKKDGVSMEIRFGC